MYSDFHALHMFVIKQAFLRFLYSFDSLVVDQSSKYQS